MVKRKGKKAADEEKNVQPEAAEGAARPKTDKISDEGGLSELEQARKDAADNYDKYLRISAEFENYKKRVSKDRTDLINFSNEKLLRDLLPVLDSLDRALDHVSNSGDFDAFVEGLGLINEKLQGMLEKHGVEKIEAVGKDFDPNYHEALMQVENGTYGNNKVVEEFEKGYLLNGRLLRPSKVTVSKNKTDQE